MELWLNQTKTTASIQWEENAFFRYLNVTRVIQGSTCAMPETQLPPAPWTSMVKSVLVASLVTLYGLF